MRRAEVIQRTGLSRSTLYAKISKGEFPEPVKLAERSVAWRESEVIGWMDTKLDARTGVIR